MARGALGATLREPPLASSMHRKTNCIYLNTVGSGIPGSAPRLKPLNKKHKEDFKHTGLHFKSRAIKTCDSKRNSSSKRYYYNYLQSSSIV